MNRSRSTRLSTTLAALCLALGGLALPPQAAAQQGTASSLQQAVSGSSIPPNVFYYKYPSVTWAKVFPVSASVQSKSSKSGPVENVDQNPSVQATYTVIAFRDILPDQTTTGSFFLQISIHVGFAADTDATSNGQFLDVDNGVVEEYDPNDIGTAAVLYIERLYTGLTWSSSQLTPIQFAPLTQTGAVSDTDTTSTQFTAGTTNSLSYTSTNAVTNSETQWAVLQGQTVSQATWSYQIATPYAYGSTPNTQGDSQDNHVMQLPILSLVGGSLDASAVLQTQGTPSSVTLQPFVQLGMAYEALYSQTGYGQSVQGDSGPSGPFQMPAITVDLTKVPQPPALNQATK
jgi:hypothetical protein